MTENNVGWVNNISGVRSELIKPQGNIDLHKQGYIVNMLSPPPETHARAPRTRTHSKAIIGEGQLR